MALDFSIPTLGEKAQSGDIVTVLVREGDVIAKNDAVIEVETEKAVVEVACPHAGKIVKVYVTKGQTVTVGQPVLSIEVAESSKKRKKMPKAPKTEPAAVSPGVQPQRGTREPAVPPGELGQDEYGHVRREPMSEIRQTIAAQMLKSTAAIPHVTNFDDADVTELERMRKTVPPAYLGPTVKLTAMPFALKAVATALRQHPVLNSTLDEERREIVYKQYINIGVAVDTPRGPVAPVLHNVDQMGVLQIARELTLLAARARSGDFSPDELHGGTFTLSNLGAVGGVYSTPIINHPQAAILQLGRSRWMLSVFEGKIEGRLKMPLSLAYDPRIVDGATACRFLNDVIDYLQSPGKLLLTK